MRMRKRGSRPLTELYDLTKTIKDPEITPMLERSCRMEDPADELDNQLPVTKECTFVTANRCASKNKNISPKTESGTCNTCSAPCSSCMHLNQTVSYIESNIDCRREDDCCSSVAVEGLPFYKSQTCQDNHHVASETSNLVSFTSSHDPKCENAESKATTETGVYDVCDAVDMPSKVSSCAGSVNVYPSTTKVTADSVLGSLSKMIGCKTFSSQSEEPLVTEHQGDTMSCISAVRDIKAEGTDCNLEVRKKDLPHTSGSTSSPLSNGTTGKARVCATSSGPSTHIREYSRKKTGPSLAEPRLSEPIHLNAQLSLDSDKGFSFHHNGDSKDLIGNPSSQMESECSMENVGSVSKLELPADSVNQEKLNSLSNNEENKISCIRSDNSSVALRDTDPSNESKIQHVKANAFIQASAMHVSQVQARPNVVDDSYDPVSGLYDVKVCDTCGDAGREEFLAICSRCSDGAEHTYCMRKKLDKLPEGDWLCEECKTKDTQTLTADKPKSAHQTSKPSSVNEKICNTVSTCNNSLLPKLNTKSVGQEVRLGVKALDTAQASSTRDGDNLMDTSATTKKASEAGYRQSGAPSTNLNTRVIDQEAILDVRALEGTQVSSTRHGYNLVDSSVTTKKGSEASNRYVVTASKNLHVKTEDKEARLDVKALQNSEVSSARHGDNLVDGSVTTKKGSETSSRSVATANIHLHAKTVDPKARLDVKALQNSQVSSTRHGDNLVDGSVTTKKGSEASSRSVATASKLHVKTVDPEARVDVKALQSSLFQSTKHKGNLMGSSVTTKKGSVASGRSTGAVSPRQKKILSREVSLSNLDIGKVTQVNMGSSLGDQSARNDSTIPRLKTSLSCNSLKIQAPLQSPRAPVSRSNSFSNSRLKLSPKVKQWTADIPHRVKEQREPTSISRLSKSTSFKSGSLNRPNMEMVGNRQSLISPRRDDASCLKQVEERDLVEKKNFSAHDHPSALAGTGIPEVNLHFAQYNARLKGTSESLKLSMCKPEVSDNGNYAGCQEEKQQFSQKFGSQSSEGTCGTADIKSRQVSKDRVRANSLTTEGTHEKGDRVVQKKATQAEPVIRRDITKDARDVKTKNILHLSSPKQLVPGGNRVVRCERCNETGHPTHFCPISKLSTTALMPLVERVSKETIKMSNKWKAAVEATNKKIPIENNRLPDHSEKFQPPGAGCELTSDTLSNSTIGVTGLPYLDGRTHGQEAVTDSDDKPGKVADNDVKQTAMQTVEDSCVLTVNDTNIMVSDAEDLAVNTSILTIDDHSSTIPKSLNTSAIPEFDFIWQGGFEVTRCGRLPELFHGIQAHLSTCASPKIPQVVSKFSRKIQLEEVPRMSSWPLQYQRTVPKNDDIALFLFAKDIESYEKYYSQLVENMLTNDLALRGNIDGVELLIFASNTLPANSQCWNMLYFLWGVFRGSSVNCQETSPDSQKTILIEDTLVPDMHSPHISDGSYYQKIDLNENPDVGSSWCDNSYHMKEVNQEKNQNLSLLPQTSAKVWFGDRDSGAVYMKNSRTSSKEDVDEPPSHNQANIIQASSNTTNCKEGTSAERCQNEEKAREKGKTMGKSNDTSCSSSPSRKRARSVSVETVSQTFGKTSRIPEEANMLSESTNWTAEDNREYKKMKLFEQRYPSIGLSCEKFGCKTSTQVHPLHGSSVNLKQPSDAISGDADSPQRHVLTTELAPGHENKFVKQKELPLLFPFAKINGCSDTPRGPVEEDYGQMELPLLFSLDRNGNQEMPPGPALDDPSLTLSLSFPTTSTKPVLRTEIPDEPHVNTSLLLFSGFHDT